MSRSLLAYRPGAARSTLVGPVISKVLASSFIVAVLGAQLWAVVDGREDFPTTATPMFAHRVDDDSRRYMFRFRAHRPAATTKKWTTLKAKDVRLSDAKLMRAFFARWYGGVGPDSPFDIDGPDDLQAFEARLSEFFRRYVAALKRSKRAGITEIRLELRRRLKSRRKKRRLGKPLLLGTYDLGTQSYLHTYRPNLLR
jgi:hypothetical protein